MRRYCSAVHDDAMKIPEGSVVEGSVVSPVQVFQSKRPPPTRHPKEFAPLEHAQCDDELVYPIPVPVLEESVNPTTSAVPVLHVTRKLGGRKSLMFESLVVGCFCEALVDSGASHSFVSVEFMRDNNILYTLVSAPEATLADGSSLTIVGIARNLTVSIGHFKFN
jgi:hypothetical protein